MVQVADESPPDRPGTELLTFLIADVRGYTRFTVEYGDEAAAQLAATFARIAREGVAARGGEVIELRGDEALAVFRSTRQALWAATDLQHRFTQEERDDPSLLLRVGIGIDAGEAVRVEAGYRGAALNRAARLCGLAGPGEVLVSDGVVHLAGKIPGLDYADRGPSQLKGFSDPVQIVEVVAADTSRTGSDETRDTRGVEQHLPIGGFLGALPQGELAGREEELRRIVSAVDAVVDGTGQLVLLAGEPGIGKTRLAQEVTLDLRNRDFLVAAGRCYEPQSAVPYYPFLEALARVYEAAPASVRSEVARRWPYLGQLLPDQIPAHSVPSHSADDQQRLFRAVAGFLTDVARNVPLALLIDDLHWADSASLELLHHLARETRDQRLFLLGTYRDVEVGRHHPLEGALRDLNREALVERIDVRRLAPADTAVLIAASMGESEISDEFRDLIHRRTEGNPYFVQQVLRVLVERGDVFRRGERWDSKRIEEIEVPESIRSVVGQRLSPLAGETQEILHEASVLGQTFAFDDLLIMAERAEREVEAALEEATTAGLVRETGRDGYSFDHALTQQSLYAELSSRRKRRLHLAAGEALEALPEPKREKRAAELAWHFLEAHEPGRALHWALQAGDQAERLFAQSEAEWQYRTALELAGEVGDDMAQVQALEKLGDVLRVLARNAEALEMLEQAAVICERLRDVEMEAQVIERIGRVHAQRGTPEEGIARLQPVLSALDESGEHISLRRRAGLHVALAHLYFAGGRNVELLDVAERAVQLAEEAGDDALLAAAESRRGVGLLDRGRLAEARQAFERAIRLAEAVGDLETAARSNNNMGDAYFLAGELRRALHYWQRNMEMAERLGHIGGMMFSQQQVGAAHVFLGDWTAARPHLERAMELARSVPTNWHSPYAPVSMGILLLCQGAEEDGMRLVEEGVRQAEKGGDAQLLFVAHTFLAERDLLQSRPESAVARLLPMQVRADRPAEIASLLAWAYLELGDEGRATELLRDARQHVVAQNHRVDLWQVLAVSAMLAMRQDRWEEADTDLYEALSLTRDMPYPLAEGRVLHEYGRLRAARGAPAEARERFEEALAIFRRLGARPDIWRTDRALIALTR